MSSRIIKQYRIPLPMMLSEINDLTSELVVEIKLPVRFLPLPESIVRWLSKRGPELRIDFFVNPESPIITQRLLLLKQGAMTKYNEDHLEPIGFFKENSLLSMGFITYYVFLIRDHTHLGQ